MSADISLIKALLDKIRIVQDEAELQALLAELSSAAFTRSVRVAFVNAHALNLCYKNPDFLRDLSSCDYIFRDGLGMKILYQLLGRDEGLNMNGTDFIPRLLAACANYDVALMGTDTPYIERAAEKIAAMGLHPTLLMNGFRDDESYVEQLRGNPARLVVLAMGMPKQERVAAKITALDHTSRLIVCGGAILDFIAEKVQRAPEFYRRWGMEWVYRLKQEPRRLFTRYVIGNPLFLRRAICLYIKVKEDRRFSTTDLTQ
jgi:N-acetylglucosaminyldiphosphoundecaprenol N-acetyl-beta-D-mannosaminyltransferase